MKKGYAEGIVQVAILLSLLRTDINNYFNSFDSPEITEIILGQSLAYSQTQFHSQTQSWLNRYSGHIISPKAVDNDYYVNSIMRDLRSLNDYRYRVRAHDTDLDTWLVNEVSDLRSSSGSTVNSGEEAPVTPSSSAPNGEATDSSDRNVRTTTFGEASDLTKEDMDLIEILWQQDIDLGVSRTAFDGTLREKAQDVEFHPEETKNATHVEKPVEGPPQGISIDNETGEWIPIPDYTNNNEEPLILATTEDTAAVEGTSLDTFDLDEAMKILEDQLASQVAATDPEPLPTPYDPVPNLVEETPDFGEIISSSILDQYTQGNADPTDFLDEVTGTHGGLDEGPSLAVPTTPEQPMYEAHNNPPLFQREMSVEQRWNDLTSIMLEDVTRANDTEIFHGQDFQLPQTSPGSTLLPHYNSSLPTTSNATNLDFATDVVPVLFPNVTSIEPARNESLMDMLKSNDLDVEPMELGDLNDMDMNYQHKEIGSTRPRQLSLCTSESYADSAISGMSSPCRDMDEESERNNSPYDGLLGATGGGYQSTTKSGKSKDEFYDSDGSFNDYSTTNYDNTLNYSSSSNDTGRRPSTSDIRHVNHNHTYNTQPGHTPREVKQYVKKEKDKVKETRDEKKIRSLKLPLSLEEIVKMPVDDLNNYIQEQTLTEDQLQLIRDIRRRGKNKVAAQNCRKRKMNEIDILQEEADKFKNEGAQLLEERRTLEDELSQMRRKYDHLYEEVFRSLKGADGDPYNPEQFSLQMTSDGAWVLMPRNSTTLERTESKPTSEPKKKGRSKRKK